MSTRKPLKATDRRRQSRKAASISEPDDDSSGSTSPLADLFNDRRRPNGKGKRAIK